MVGRVRRVGRAAGGPGRSGRSGKGLSPPRAPQTCDARDLSSRRLKHQREPLTGRLRQSPDDFAVALTRTAHRREPIDRAARKQSRIANTTIMVIEFH